MHSRVGKLIYCFHNIQGHRTPLFFLRPGFRTDEWITCSIHAAHAQPVTARADSMQIPSNCRADTWISMDTMYTGYIHVLVSSATSSWIMINHDKGTLPLKPVQIESNRRLSTIRAVPPLSTLHDHDHDLLFRILFEEDEAPSKIILHSFVSSS